MLAGVSFLLSGCSPKKQEPSKAPTPITIQQIDLTGLRDKINENDGKLKVVNFWASWCDPCKEEMPYLVKLNSNYKDKIELILVAIDDPDSIDAVLRPVLVRSGVEFTSYIKKEGNDDQFINGIDSSWGGNLPATFIYNNLGTQVEKLVSGQTYNKFEEAIKKYLN